MNAPTHPPAALTGATTPGSTPSTSAHVGGPVPEVDHMGLSNRKMRRGMHVPCT